MTVKNKGVFDLELNRDMQRHGLTYMDTTIAPQVVNSITHSLIPFLNKHLELFFNILPARFCMTVRVFTDSNTRLHYCN